MGSLERLSALRNGCPGNDLLSHSASAAVPSALEDLTAVFGMGTGVAPPLGSPGRKTIRCGWEASGVFRGREPAEPLAAAFAPRSEKTDVVKSHGRLVPVS